ncbi:methyltransferase domain-containing protein [candidate division KSB1 bacterium]|nr:methyltransferase domain-containing protein [candidate division KSB1 bacterium]
MKNYYSESLHSLRLQKCYDIAPHRVQQYLDAEIRFVADKIKPDDSVLELGCGYGRVIHRLSEKAGMITGIDISEENILYAKKLCSAAGNCQFYTMNAIDLDFDDSTFDVVFCIQNGLSAFKVEPKLLVREALRVTKKSGIALFSSYSHKFWGHRIEWFRIQAQHGLIGTIDHAQTGNGVIVCKDGFKATTFSAADFLKLTAKFDVETSICEVDDSSIFCEMTLKH